MANNFKVKNFSNSATNTSQALFTASASTTLVKSIIVNCDKATPNATATLKLKKSGGAEELVKRVTVTSQDVSTELLYDVLPLEAGDALYVTSSDTDLNFMMSWVENTTAAIGASLNALSDVDTTGVANGDVLTYNSTSGNWEAEAPAAGGDIFKTIAVAGQSSIVADSSTDTLTIAAGTGITLTTNASTDTLTITNSATGANAFGSVAVAGQTTVEADSTGDTLTLVAGTGVTITTNATTDTVTITNSVTAPNSFDTITVAGQSSVVAESSSDTLALVAAGGMTITTNATTDTITLDSARLDDDDVTLSAVREIDLNGENLNIVNGAFEILMVEADGVRQANTVIADYAGSVGGRITLAEASVNGVHSIAIQAPASLAASTTFTLPSADGTSAQVLQTNGAGTLSFVSLMTTAATASVGAYLELKEAANNGTNYIRLQAPATLAADKTYTLPAEDGTSGQVMQTNGSGSLSFVTKKATQVTGKTVLTGAWSLVSGVYEASISDAAILATSIVDVIPNNADASTIRTAGLLPRTDSSSGAVKIYATSAPAATITVTLNIFDL